MKVIGLIAGMSWESSAVYYQVINEEVKHRLGGHHSARIAMFSVDFQDLLNAHDGRGWPAVAELAVDAAQRLARAGAEGLVICTNTVHKVAPEVEAAVDLPLIHIADAAAEAIKAQGLKTVGLLGTRFTLTEGFYRHRLKDRHGLRVLVPEPADIELVNSCIYDELVLGQIKDSSRREFQRIIEALAGLGAEGVILGCTEIPLLIKQEDSRIPLFDTTTIHALAAVDWALGED